LFVLAALDGPVRTGSLLGESSRSRFRPGKLGIAQLLCRECRGLLGDGSGSRGVFSFGMDNS
jgi:hypothetical protein